MAKRRVDIDVDRDAADHDRRPAASTPKASGSIARCEVVVSFLGRAGLRPGVRASSHDEPAVQRARCYTVTVTACHHRGRHRLARVFYRRRAGSEQSTWTRRAFAWPEATSTQCALSLSRSGPRGPLISSDPHVERPFATSAGGGRRPRQKKLTAQAIAGEKGKVPQPTVPSAGAIRRPAANATCHGSVTEAAPTPKPAARPRAGKEGSLNTARGLERRSSSQAACF